MKQHFIPAIRLTLVCIIIFMGVYTLAIFGIAQLTPSKGKGETITQNRKVIGYALEGQKFTDDKYFNSRPSAVDYNAAASGGSNKGTTNPDYLKTVNDRLDTFLVHNPSVKKEQVPSELITASGSGLDPDLSPQGVYIQVPRIAAVRHLNEDEVNKIVDANIQSPLLSMFGTAHVNVLQLNVALDAYKHS